MSTIEPGAAVAHLFNTPLHQRRHPRLCSDLRPVARQAADILAFRRVPPHPLALHGMETPGPDHDPCGAQGSGRHPRHNRSGGLGHHCGPPPAASRRLETATGGNPGGHAAVPVSRVGNDSCPLTATASGYYAEDMAFSRELILDALARLPFTDAGELALILGEPLATVHRALTGLLRDGLAGRASHGTSHLPSSHRYYLTKNGIAEAADVLDYDAPSDFVRAYPVSRQWLTLLLRRMDAVAPVYRLAATLSPGVDGLETRVEFQRRGRFDAVITLRNGRTFGAAAPVPGAAAPLPLRPAAGHRRVPPQPPSLRGAGAGPQPLGTTAHRRVLLERVHQGLLRRRGEPGHSRSVGPNGLDFVQMYVR